MRIFEIAKKANMLPSALAFKQLLEGNGKAVVCVAGLNFVLSLVLITQTRGKPALFSFEHEGEGLTCVTSGHQL